MSGKVPDDCWVPNDPLICDNCQGEVCHAVLGKVSDDCWVLDDPLVFDGLLICDDRQGRTCHCRHPILQLTFNQPVDL